MSQLQEIYARALELPEPQRAALAHQLLLSLEAEPFDTDWSTAWEAELDSRLAEAEATAGTKQDWRAVLAAMRRSLPTNDEL